MMQIENAVLMGSIAILIILIVLGIYIYLIYPSKKVNNNLLYDLMRNKFAHRGLHTKDQKVPENSALAFNLAKMFSYGIELDLNLTKDGEVIVFHDDNLKRACSFEGEVKDQNYNDIKNLSLFRTDEIIPKFSDTLKLINGDVPLIIEFKNTPNYKELCEKSCELLDGYKGKYCIESFNPYIVGWFYKNRPDIIRGQLSAGMKSFEGQNIFVRFIISSLLVNVIGRPHFVAYKYDETKRKLGFNLFKKFGGKTIGWTIDDASTKKKQLEKFDTIIFEYFKL